MDAAECDDLESQDHVFLAAARDLYKTSITCPAQQLAENTTISDILKCDFSWTTTTNGESYSTKIDIDSYEHAMWTEFIRQLLQEFMRFGFALYRLKVVRTKPADQLEERNIGGEQRKKKAARAKRRKKEETRDPFRCPEVASGLNIVLRWGDTEHRWIPYTAEGKKFLRTDGWRMLQPNPPDRVGTSNFPLYKSCASSAARSSKLRAKLYTNIGKRDDRNTSVEVYSQTAKNVNMSSSGTGTQEWFQSAMHGAMGTAAAPGDIFKPLDTVVDDRIETFVGFKKVTDHLRMLERDDRRQNRKIGRKDSAKPDDTAKDHTEHIIGEGMEAREVSYRRAPEEIMRILDELFISILMAYNVMPQVVGKNINSERIAAGNRMAEVSIERYIEHIRQLRRFVQMAVTEVSKEAVGDANTSVRMNPCITAHTLRMVESVLKTEDAIRLYSCVYDIPEELFDPARMKLKQTAMLIKPETGGEESNPTANTRNKQPMSEDQKDASMKAKNEP